METAKVAVSINKNTLSRLDKMVQSHIFPSRSRAVQEAIEEKLNRMERTRLARECAKADVTAEQALAEEGISYESAEWPEY
jgi:metal-responsive CopG/Arc/MetJ family transcriptional regulator